MNSDELVVMDMAKGCIGCEYFRSRADGRPFCRKYRHGGFAFGKARAECVQNSDGSSLVRAACSKFKDRMIEGLAVYKCSDDYGWVYTIGADELDDVLSKIWSECCDG